jgi:uncharacterized membrane protein
MKVWEVLIKAIGLRSNGHPLAMAWHAIIHWIEI